MRSIESVLKSYGRKNGSIFHNEKHKNDASVETPGRSTPPIPATSGRFTFNSMKLQMGGQSRFIMSQMNSLEPLACAASRSLAAALKVTNLDQISDERGS